MASKVLSMSWYVYLNMSNVIGPGLILSVCLSIMFKIVKTKTHLILYSQFLSFENSSTTSRAALDQNILSLSTLLRYFAPNVALYKNILKNFHSKIFRSWLQTINAVNKPSNVNLKLLLLQDLLVWSKFNENIKSGLTITMIN